MRGTLIFKGCLFCMGAYYPNSTVFLFYQQGGFGISYMPEAVGHITCVQGLVT